MKEADMKKKICPIMSRPAIAPELPSFILCQGSACLAFSSQPTYVYLAEDGESATDAYNKRKRFTDKSQVVKTGPTVIEDDIEEINRLVAEGWERQGGARGVLIRKTGEPTCWCDAMPANAQCGYEAP